MVNSHNVLRRGRQLPTQQYASGPIRSWHFYWRFRYCSIGCQSITWSNFNSGNTIVTLLLRNLVCGCWNFDRNFCLPARIFFLCWKKEQTRHLFFHKWTMLDMQICDDPKKRVIFEKPVAFFQKKVFFIFNIYIVYLFINDLCHINYNRAV